MAKNSQIKNVVVNKCDYRYNLSIINKNNANKSGLKCVYKSKIKF